MLPHSSPTITPPRGIEAAIPRYWPLLFPLTFLAHVGEEYVGGFPAWSSAVLGFRLTPTTFLQFNAVAWIGMFCGTLAATVGPRALVVPFATATFINGCAHLVASVLTASYSPGVITGTLLWIPLGGVTLRRAWRHLSERALWTGVVTGAVLHAVVVLLARS